MRDQLIRYVDLLFAGAPDSEEIKQEILQNTLDRYDDLTAQGKAPEAAYRLAISGIGDISEILGETAPAKSPAAPAPAVPAKPWKVALRAIAVGLYILSPTPLFVLSEMGMDTVGLCGMLSMVAVATVLMLLGKKSGTKKETAEQSSSSPSTSPRQELRKSFGSLIWAIGLALYFLLSFATQAWYITWVLFPIIGSVQGLINACIDLKEAK